MKILKDLVEYLGEELNEVQIERLIAFVAFHNMKSYIKFDEIWLGKLKDKQDFEFFRKGKIGNWKNYFTAEMSRRIDEMVKLKLTYNKKHSIIYETK